MATCTEASDTLSTDAIFNEIVSTLNAKGWSEPSVIIEGQNSLFKETIFTLLKARVREDWRHALSCSINDDSQRIKRTVFLIASQSLDKMDYLEMLKELTGEVQRNEFSPYELELAVFPSNESLSNVLVDSWSEPATQRLIEDLKKIFQNDHALVGYLESVSSGAAKVVSADFAARSMSRSPVDDPTSSQYSPISRVSETSNGHFLTPTQNERNLHHNSVISWSGVVTLFIAAIILLWFLLRKRR